MSSGELVGLKALTAAVAHESRRLVPTRRTLLSRLKNWGDDASWREFFDTYWKVIYNAARKAGLTDAESQDVVQETVLSVCRSMGEFKYDPKAGTFRGWLMQLTRWRIVDQYRKRLPLAARRRKKDGEEEDALDAIADEFADRWEKVWMEEWEKNLVERAIAAVKVKVKAKHYQVFDLYYFKKWDSARIARELSVTRAWVYVVQHRLTRKVEKELQRLNRGRDV